MSSEWCIAESKWARLDGLGRVRDTSGIQSFIITVKYC